MYSISWRDSINGQEVITGTQKTEAFSQCTGRAVCIFSYRGQGCNVSDDVVILRKVAKPPHNTMHLVTDDCGIKISSFASLDNLKRLSLSITPSRIQRFFLICGWVAVRMVRDCMIHYLPYDPDIFANILTYPPQIEKANRPIF